MSDLINPFNTFQKARDYSSAPANTGTARTRQAERQSDVPDEIKARTVNDTVELSDGAKQINLARGFDLAEQVRQEKDTEKVAELLKSGQEDITRIGALFREVAREIQLLFGGSRR